MRYYLKQRLTHFAHTMDIIRRVILSLIFWSLVLILLITILGNRPPSVKSDSLLVLNPQGTLVDAYTTPVNYRGVPFGGYLNETLLDNLITALDMASADPRISGLWINLSNMRGGGTAAVGELADAVKRFGESGKNIISSADTYDNARYRIASSSDYILVDRIGEVFPTGYGYFRAYYAEGLEKFGVKAELFRSGESKTGAENYILDGMSEAARRDETRLLTDLWGTWLNDVAANRGIDAEDLSEWINNYDVYLAAAGGDGSKSALEAGLVDLVETGGVLKELLDTQFGVDESRRIDAVDYVLGEFHKRGKDGTLAIIPITGTLVYGEGAAGTAGSADIVQTITAARDTQGVKAIVLRIDSPGGDVRAGEEIRRVLEETRRTWKLPVVVSMGNLAASGGYWIAAESDLIVTRPETITGSIGVYSMSLSFEEALSRWLGVHIDGIGTTPWAGTANPGRDLDERTASIYSSGVKDIDDQFRSLVAEKRGLTAEEVDKLAGGIPWSGSRALENGLADLSGGLKEAEESAAELAGLDEWNTLYFEKTGNPGEKILGRLLWGKQSIRAADGHSFMWRTSNLLRLHRSSSP